jgi:hypothetical protein
MFIPIVVGVLGLMLGGRTKPLSKHKKMLMLGPRSGEHYQVEDMPNSAIIIVHAKDATVVTFNRDPETQKLKFKCAHGRNRGTVDMVRQDFEEPAELPASGAAEPARGFPRAVG